MAVSISGTTNESVYTLTKWTGLNENPDGDTKLKFGEAVACRNWKVTRDYNLQRRPGTRTMLDFGSNGNVNVWRGRVAGKETILAATGGHLYLVNNEDWTYKDLGKLDTTNRVNFFPFDGIVYILNGKQYSQYDGYNFGAVVGYRPMIYTAMSPDLSNITASPLEEVNKLNGLRRIRYSPDGTATEFKLPEKDLMSVDYVMYSRNGEYMDHSHYTVDTVDGTVTFDTAPEAAVSSIEIGYSAPAPYRSDVSTMTNAEIFLGAQDNAVFLYGNGTNKAIYSGVDYEGVPRADYFPDLNEMAVADANTPITGMIRHYTKLICYKSNSTYSVQFGTITLANGSQEYGFYITPINRDIGNAALGQVRLVLNSPYALFGKDLYQWKTGSSRSPNLTIDERQAVRISDNIYATLKEFKAEDCYCFDDNDNQEYYICYHGKCLVQNYAAGAWYLYDNLNVHSMYSYGEDLYIGTTDGKIKCLSLEFRNDDGQKIESYWESGSIDFGKSYMRKILSEMWVGITPNSNGKVTVTIMTDKKAEHTQKSISSQLFDFSSMNFDAFSFDVNRRSQVKKVKIKGKKFVYLKLIFMSDEMETTATVVNANLRIRTTGYAK